jgi:carbon-monoxide dehydrogenase medium subunit
MLSDLGEDAKVLAGGQSLVPMLNLRLARPAHLVDVARIPELRGIRESGDDITIGATTTQRDIERSDLIRQRYPIIAEAVSNIAHPPIRTRGTFGGSLAHADPAAELPAIALLLEAKLVATSKRGERVIPASSFFQTYLTSALEPDELLTEIRLPAMPGNSTWAFLEVSRRHGDFALVGVAALVGRSNGSVESARIALFGVGPTPLRAAAAESLAAGAKAGDGLWREMASAASPNLDPPSDLHGTAAYRRHVAEVLTFRALQAADGGKS